MILDNKLETITIGTLNIFCVAAELESFVGTAELLGLTPATVSRSISRLEDRLKVKLFSRTTRQVKLTQLGRKYYQTCSAAVKDVNDIENDLINEQASPKGSLRISVPTTYGYYRLMPILVKFEQKYPDIQLSLDVSNTNVDFITDSVDLSIRLGDIPDSRLVSIKLEEAPLGIYATSEYLDTFGTPSNIDDLNDHKCIQFIMPNSGRLLPWILYKKGEKISFMPKKPTYISGDVLAAICYANEGGGIFQTYDFIANHLENKNLVPILPTYKGASRPFHLVYPYSRYLPNKIKVFISFLRESLN